MGKIRRGNFIFVNWIGDHGHHVHVYRDRRLVVKWDLDLEIAIEGRITRKILKYLRKLKKEGEL